MKKTVSGVFVPCYYNLCEACPPFSIKRDNVGYDDDLCELFREVLEIKWLDDTRKPQHSLMGKRVTITIEVENHTSGESVIK